MQNVNKFDICYIIKLDKATSSKTFFFKIQEAKINKKNLLKSIIKLPINNTHPTMELKAVEETKVLGLCNGHTIKFINEWEQLSSIPYLFKVVFSGVIPPHHILNSVCYIDERQNYTQLQIDQFILNHVSNIMKVNIKPTHRMVNINNLTVGSGVYNTSTILSFESNSYCFDENISDNKLNNDILEMHSYIIDSIFNMDGVKDLKYLNKGRYILTDFSIDNHFMENKSELTKHKLRKEIENKEDADNLYEIINLAKNSINKDEVSNENLDNYIEEMDYIDTLIGIFSSSTFSATLKADCYVNDVYTDIHEIAKKERDEYRNTKTLESIRSHSKKISSKLTQKSGNIIQYLDKASICPIKIISNLPLEWITVNRLPLMINFPTSRIPKTPIQLLEHFTLERNFNISVNYKDIFEVLVIRSFDEEDYLKYQLENNINKIILDPVRNECYKNVIAENLGQEIEFNLFDINFVDVSELSELINALNNSTENIVIFDMHGGHDVNGTGGLCIGNAFIPISELFNKIHRMPPIAILSSCDTSSIDRNSYSVSAGLLLLGAHSVLGSALPINGHESARFITRLLLRIRLYLPEYFQRHDFIRWSNFIHGMIKREYFTDLQNFLLKIGVIKSDKEKLSAGMAIGEILENYVGTNLMEEVLIKICSITNSEFDLLSKRVEDNFFYAESIKYFHLGNPENIMISKDANPF